MLDVKAARILSPASVLVENGHIVAAGPQVNAPAGTRTVDLGEATLMPGLIDVHVHLFLHPGAEDLQTVEESVPQRTIVATLAARADLMAGFTAERDMGTEGAGSADTAVRNAIDEGSIPGPRLRISGNAVDILGGHEDGNRFNPQQHVLSNADRANGIAEIIRVMRQQFKEGADFTKIYETGRDSLAGGQFHTPYQYTRRRTKRSRARGYPSGEASGRSCHRGTGNVVCGKGRRGVDRSRRPALQRNDEADARPADLCRAHVCHQRILCRTCGHARAIEDAA